MSCLIRIGRLSEPSFKAGQGFLDLPAIPFDRANCCDTHDALQLCGYPAESSIAQFSGCGYARAA
jgi:hypothetical protein